LHYGAGGSCLGAKAFRVIGTGFAIAGVYSSCYLLAMEHGLRPGMLATLLGIQPLVTLAVTEHRFSARRVGDCCSHWPEWQ
jgi:hypothetical protein